MSTHEEPRRRPRWSRLGLLAALVVVPALLLAACGSDDSGGDGTDTEAAADGEAPFWCGDQEVTIGIYDGGGLNEWSAQSFEQVQAAVDDCPNITDTVRVDAGFDPQAGVAGLQSMIAQGVDAIVLIPDAGVCAELPSIKQATQREIVVVPWAADSCGQEGTDFFTYVDFDNVEAGREFARFVGDELGGEGNVIWLGGPAGNPVDAGEIKGMYEVFDSDYPDINVLGNVTEENWPVTNWDPAEASKVTAALLAQYPQIDGILSSFGTVVEAGLKEFEKANRQFPKAIATLEQNALACLYDDKLGTPDEFALATVSNRNWLGQVAVRKAVAEVNGIDDPGNSIVILPLTENSTDENLQPVCDPAATPDTYHTNADADQLIADLVDSDSN